MALRCVLLTLISCSACLSTPGPGSDAGTPLSGACSPSRRGQVPTLRRVHSQSVVMRAPLWTRSLDADGDGDLDLYTSFTDSDLQLFLNDGQKLAPPLTTNPETGALEPQQWGYNHDGYFGSSPLFHDFQKDGRPDLYAAHNRSTDGAHPVVEVHLAGDAGLSGDSPISFRANPSSVPGAVYGRYQLADFDGDDTVDLLELGRGEGDEEFMVVHKRGPRTDGGAGYLEFWRTPHTGLGARVIDLDGDGARDLIFPRSTGTSLQFDVFINDGQGRFQTAPESSEYPTPDPSDEWVGDLNGDGRADVVFQWRGAPPYQVVVGLNTDGKHFAFTRYSGSMRLVADVDGDCSPDLIGNDHLTGAPNVRLNDGAGNFDQTATLDIGSRYFVFSAGDWSGDGCADFMVSPSGGGQWDVMKSER